MFPNALIEYFFFCQIETFLLKGWNPEGTLRFSNSGGQHGRYIVRVTFVEMVKAFFRGGIFVNSIF